MKLCKHGYPIAFFGSVDDCGVEQPDGATVEELDEIDRVTIRNGTQTIIIVPALGNKKGIVHRKVKINGEEYTISGFESCLIPGHDTGHCFCFGSAGLLIK